MGRLLVFVAGAVLAYVGSAYIEGFLKANEEENEKSEQAEG